MDNYYLINEFKNKKFNTIKEPLNKNIGTSSILLKYNLKRLKDILKD